MEVNAGRIPTKCAVAVKYLQRRWDECGSPTEHKPLQDFLDEALTFCVKVEYLYPKVVLKRLKQMQRGEWEPKHTGPDVTL